MAKATDIFTPTKRPTFTSVRREAVWDDLESYIEQGGGFVSLLGTTKLGKSTLVESALETSIFGVSIPGQTLITGVDALWRWLVDELGIHTSAQTGLANSRGVELAVAARLGMKEIAEGEIGLKGLAGKNTSATKDYVIDPAKAVQSAFSTIAGATEDHQNPPIIAIDDFHFVTDPTARRSLILALRPIAQENVTVLLATLPGREDDDGFESTNVGGRHYVVHVPRWEDEDLRAIATAGFVELNAAVETDVVDQLIDESLGSPQLMQQLCLNLCRVNSVKMSGVETVHLKAPADWTEFFRKVRDPQSVAWLERLGLGLTQRRPRNRYPTGDGKELDAYQLILQALHEAGSAEASLADLKIRIGAMVGRSQTEVSRMNLDQIAKNMNVVASREMTDALQASLDAAESADGLDEATLFASDEVRLATRVPQPVFEVVGENGSDLMVRILDPLLEYTLKWHPEAFATRAR